MILLWFYKDSTRKLWLPMTSSDVLGRPRTSQDLIWIIMISYNLSMILQWLYNETMISNDLLRPPRTYQDLPGPPNNLQAPPLPPTPQAFDESTNRFSDDVWVILRRWLALKFPPCGACRDLWLLWIHALLHNNLQELLWSHLHTFTFEY